MRAMEAMYDDSFARSKEAAEKLMKTCDDMIEDSKARSAAFDKRSDERRAADPATHADLRYRKRARAVHLSDFHALSSRAEKLVADARELHRDIGRLQDAVLGGPGPDDG